MDCREKCINEIARRLSEKFEHQDLTVIQSMITIVLENYELTERTTEVGFVDNSTDQLLKIFGGTLLSEGKSANTVKAYADMIKRFERDVNKPLLEVTTYDIRLYLAKRQQFVSLRTCNNDRNYLSAFYEFLHKEGIIKENPTDRVQAIKYDEPIEYAHSIEEIDLLRSAVKNQKERAMLEVLLATGLRATEFGNLELRDIDFNKRTVMVRHGKGNKNRVVPISGLALMHLNKYLSTRIDDKPYLFVSKNGTPYNKNTLGTMARKWAKIAGITHVHPHRFRKTFATDLFRKGMDVRSIQKLLGHSSLNTTMLYLGISYDHISLDYARLVA